MNRWAFDHAYAMIEEFNMGRSEAFRQAYLVRDLIEALGQGEVVFQYKKQDGELREARGTLCRGISAVYDAYEYKTDGQDGSKYPKLEITYWDLDREAFRSFSIARLEPQIKRIKKGTTNFAN